jgi:HEAT repeat protein
MRVIKSRIAAAAVFAVFVFLAGLHAAEDKSIEYRVYLKIEEMKTGKPLAGARVRYRLAGEWYDFKDEKQVSSGKHTALGDKAGKGKGKQANFSGVKTLSLKRGKFTSRVRIMKEGYEFEEFRVRRYLKLGKDKEVTVYKEIKMSPMPANRMPAFPGAEGYGAAATGGRGGRVVKVTNLNAKGPGSLQWACMQKGPVIVVFDVSGVIRPPNRAGDGRWLSIRRNDITIAGQTAPGAGITIEGMVSTGRGDRSVPKDQKAFTQGRVRNLIVRFLRIRPTEGSGNLRALEFLGCRRAIADHVSGSWALDQCFNPGYAIGDDEITFQWCGVEETDIQLENGQPHAYAMLTGWYDGHLTMHHNLLAHHLGRAPCIGCYRAEFSNNVMYNCGPGETRIEWFGSVKDMPVGNFNVAGNWWRTGPGGIVGWAIYRPPLVCSRRGLVPSSHPKDARYFFDGNRFAREGYVGLEKYSKERREKKVVTDEPLAMPRPVTHSAGEAYELVLAHAGCLPRDTVSARTIREVRTRTGSWGRHGPEGGLMEGLTPGKPLPDADSDGMPDAWEKAHGLNPADPRDTNKIVPEGASPGDRHKGYTFIEYYINELADLKVAEALTRARLDRTPPKPWDKPATELSGYGRKYKSLEDMVKAVCEQDPKKTGKTRRKLAYAGWFAIQQLSRMGDKAAPAVPEIVKALKAADGRAQATSLAAWALGVIGPKAGAGVPALIDALRRKQDTGYNKWVYPPYGYIAWSLGRIGMTDAQADEAVPILAGLLNGEDRRARMNIAWLLSLLGERAAPAQAELLKALGGSRPGYFAARALANIGAPAVPGLIKALGSDTDRGRANAARALGWMGPKAKDAVDALAGCLKKDASGMARGRIAEALGGIGPGDDRVASALAGAIRDAFLDVRVNAARALGKCRGPVAGKAISALADALDDKRREVRRAAALTLGKLGNAAIPALDKALSGEDALVRKYAARAAADVGRSAVDVLIAALSDKNAEVRREAVWSLALIGPAAGSAANTLNKALNDADYVVQHAAAEALKRISP